MKKAIYFLIIAITGFCNIGAQEKDPDAIFNDAEYFFSTGDYQEALYLFLKLQTLKPDHPNLNFRVGMSYLNIPGQESKAIPYLEIAVKKTSLKYKQKSYKEFNAPHHAFFYLGNAYRIHNDLDKALDAYDKFKGIKDFEKKYNIGIVDNEIKACERAKIIKDTPLNIRITNIGEPICSVNSDYAPVLTPDESVMVFLSSQRFYEAIMFSVKSDGKWSQPVNITPQVGSDGDMTPTSLSPDGKELYLAKKSGNNGDIFLSKWDGTFWSKALPLNNYINSKSNETFAAVSADGMNLYFTSNRRESLGGLDIFVSKKQSNNDWGPAVNLGSLINTSSDEVSPCLSLDGKTLYFSSQGHFNMGGFDVFYSILNKDGQFSSPLNIGYPVNTTGDNKFYFPVADGKKAYMALFNEETSLGREDVYSIEILSLLAPPISSEPLFDRDFMINLVNPVDGKKIRIVYDNKTDQFTATGENGEKYSVTIKEPEK